ncbi:MAG: four-helix bundle copper-binding protein [Flavobacteriales bacterium]|nr:four-helix bundle copper-binding protein [Flavobacteriales bacterium]
MKDQQTNALLQHLIKCITACEHCADRCLNEKDPAMMADCIRLDRDCADICTLTARYLARDSAHKQAALRLCIAICQACEEECAKHQHDHCQRCAEVCRQCRKACADHLA